MDFCPKCGGRLVPRKVWAEEEKPQYTKVWEYGKGWRSVERERKYYFVMECRKCGYKRRAEANELEPTVKAKPAPLPDMPLGSSRYHQSYMTPDEDFRDRLRQADVVDSITRRVPVGFEEFRKELLSCRAPDCRALGIDPNPIVWGEVCAKVVQISQAPSRNAGNSSRPFSKSLHESDQSGKKLIEWYGIPRETFYDQRAFYITGIGHCYPGKDRSGDITPPIECADRWLRKELSYLNPNLYIVVGRFAASYFYPERKLTELVFQNLELYGKPAFVLPHPSPAAKNWFKKNPKFEAERVHDIRKALHEALQ